MREFFGGWRRKVGCVTLLMACVLMVGWMRSFLLLEDSLYINLSGKSINRLISSPEGIAWEMMGYPFRIFRPETIDQPGPRWDSRANTRYGPFYVVDVVRDLKWCGFRYRDGRTNSGNFPSQLLIVPHWSLILPLTFVSAYLILWKPTTKIGIESELPRR